MTTKLQIDASVSDAPAVLARVILSVIAAGGRVESWVSKQMCIGVIHLTLVCSVGEETSVQGIVWRIEKVRRVAVRGIAFIQGTRDLTVKRRSSMHSSIGSRRIPPFCTRCARLLNSGTLHVLRLGKAEIRLCDACWKNWLEWYLAKYKPALDRIFSIIQS
jgi:hypothetical protein